MSTGLQNILKNKKATKATKAPKQGKLPITSAEAASAATGPVKTKPAKKAPAKKATKATKAPAKKAPAKASKGKATKAKATIPAAKNAAKKAPAPKPAPKPEERKSVPRTTLPVSVYEGVEAYAEAKGMEFPDALDKLLRAGIARLRATDKYYRDTVKPRTEEARKAKASKKATKAKSK